MTKNYTARSSDELSIREGETARILNRGKESEVAVNAFALCRLYIHTRTHTYMHACIHTHAHILFDVSSSDP